MKSPAIKTKTSLQLRTLLSLTALVFTASVASAAPEVWNAVPGTSATTNWSDTANWNPIGTPGSADTAIFGDTGVSADALTANNVVDVNTTVTALSYTNATSGNWHVTDIPAGVKLTVTGPMLVGGSTNNGLISSVAFLDAGTLSVAGNLTVGNNGSSSADQNTMLDLSGLSNFIYTNGAGTITIGFGNRSSANWKLAGVSNNVTVGTWNANATSTSSGVSGTVTLGAGTNIINVGTLNAAVARNNSTIQFPSTGAGLRLRGVGGTDTDRATLVLGNRNQNTSGGNNTGTFNFNGNAVDMKFGTMTLGEGTAATPSASQAGIGIINFDTGIIDAITINMGISTANANNLGRGAINIGAGGTLVVSNISLVNQGPLTSGTNVSGLTNAGIVNVSGSIFKTTTAGMGNITLTGGSLNLLGSGSSVGSATNAIDNFSISDAGMTLSAGLVASIYATNLVAGGSANTINVSSLPSFFSYPAQFPLISYASAGGDNNTFVAGTLPGIFKGYISNNVGGLTIDIVITNGPALAQLKSIRWNGTPTGDWTTNASTLNWLTNSTAVNYNQGDTVTFNDTLTGTTNVNLTQTLTPGAFTVNNSSANYLFTGVGNISGATGLTKTGSGTLILDNSGVNDFVGAVTISAGTLQVGNNDTNGNLPSGALGVDGTLAFNRTDSVQVSTVISGAGSLVQNGSGKLTLNAAETYTGNTLITKGTLTLGAGGSIASAAGIFPQGGAFDVTLASPSTTLNVVGANNGTVVVGTNSVTIATLSLTNSMIMVSPDFNSAQSISVTTFTTDGSTNIINVTGVQNVPDGQSLPIVIPIIRYGSATFSGGFKIGETNFPNAFVSNDVANSTIDLVLTAAPFLVTWNGGSAVGNNWSDSNNWSGVGIFLNDSLIFDGTTRLTPVNDTAAGTAYGNITFNGSAGAFTLTGNPIVFNSNILNNSGSPQTINMGLSFSNNVSLNGTGAPLIIGGGLTNASSVGGTRTVTLTGSGILTNLFGSTTTVGGTNGLIQNDAGGTWTLLDNATATPVTAPWAFELNAGTFNFGSASSAPVVTSTSGQGVPSDNQLGNSATAVLNFTNGTFTTSARFNTGGGSGSGTINQYGGTINIASQFQGANGSASATSAVNLYGGTMNIANGAGQFYVSSRGTSTLTVTNSALLNCGILDVSRTISTGVAGTVNLDGGTISATRVGTATANQVAVNTTTATFYFNGGTLKTHTNSTTFFQGSVVAPIVPINAYVTARGANIDSDTFTISFLEPLLTDPNLGGAADGGLRKLGTGTLNMNGTNTYVGQTLVGAGTLNINGQSISAVIVSNSATLGGVGVISNSVTVNAGGTLSPGASAVGTLTVATNAITLNGTTMMEVDKVQSTSDLLALVNDTPTTITYGGTLNVATVAGSLAPGDTFKLFSANNYVGSFAAITPANVTWNTSNLNVDGTLTVVSIAPAGPTTNATITKVTLSGTNLLVHGTNNNVPNNALHYVVLTATNISTALSNWTPVVTNTYNTDGTFDFSSPIVPGVSQKFIDVQAVQ